MAFDPKLRPSPDGQSVRISQRKPWYVMALGLPILAVGLYIGYFVIYAPIHYIWHGASFTEWLKALPGLLITAALAALFLLPTALFMFGAGVDVRIDKTTGIVSSQEGILPWGKRQETPIASIERVALVSEKRQGRNRATEASPTTTRTTYLTHVQLITDGGKDVLLGSYTAEEDEKARIFARGAAKFLDVSFMG